MTDSASGRWARVEQLLGDSLERPAESRDAYLESACPDDPALREEVRALLRAHERTGPIDRLGSALAPVTAHILDAPDPIVGATVGRYRVLRRMDGGGMGVVYEAEDPELGRHVAIKFLRPGLGTDASSAERFRLEARTIAALEHPNICTIFETGETTDGRLYLVMPLYDGETLQERIARGALPVPEAIDIATQVARALEKAHAGGIVHRDIKPSNVFVTRDGVVKLLDFGIAKLSDVALTGDGPTPGTVPYMSPEQARGEAVDARTDLWSLGVVLYESIAGVRPFAGGSAWIVAEAVQRAPLQPLSAHRAGVPDALERIVARALQRSPAARFQSATDLVAALRALAPGRRAPGTRRGPALAAGALLLVAAAAGVAVWSARPERLAASPNVSAGSGTLTPTPATVAVLPFADRSPRADQGYFSDGISEELIATLGRVRGIRVASRTSAFAFRGRDVDVRTIARTLGVATIVEGSVRRDGDRLRITAQLVNAADGYQLWSETYERPTGDAFAIQQEIAGAIADRLRVRLVSSAEVAAAHTPDPVAYDLYLKGRYAWYGRTRDALQSAADYFTQAVAQDSTYARAHAGLADAFAVMGFYDFLPPREAFPRAEWSASRAASLDSTLAAPHATLGYVALYHRWDLARAEAEFRRAIALEPGYSTAHQWQGNLLVAAGRFPEAARAMARAEEVDPLSLIAKAALGWVHYHAGNDAAALAQFRATLELDPDYALAHLWRGWTLQRADSLRAAVAAHRRALAAGDSADIFVAALARSLALSGARDEAAGLLARLERRAASGYVPSYEIARVYESLGQPERALDWLERALEERAHSMVLLRVDPQLGRLRDHPRYQRLEHAVFGAAER